MGGSFQVDEQSGKVWLAYLSWPVSVPPMLLVVDDNQGFVELVRRYLAGYPWQITGAVNTHQGPANDRRHTASGDYL